MGGVRLVPEARATPQGFCAAAGGQGHGPQLLQLPGPFSASTASAGPAACAAPPPASVSPVPEVQLAPLQLPAGWPCCSGPAPASALSLLLVLALQLLAGQPQRDVHFSFSSASCSRASSSSLPRFPSLTFLLLRTTWAASCTSQIPPSAVSAPAGSRRCSLLPISSLGAGHYLRSQSFSRQGHLALPGRHLQQPLQLLHLVLQDVDIQTGLLSMAVQGDG